MFARLPLLRVRRAAVVAVALILVVGLGLAGCGVTQVSSPPNHDAPTTRTAQTTPTTGLPTPGRSTPTMTNVTITTDSQTYRMGETIHVTITNHLRTPVYTAGGKMNCTVVEAQMKTAQGWQKASIAPCSDADMSDIVQIAAGATRAVTLATAGDAFAAGTYRLALSYSTYSIPPQMSAPFNGGFGSGRPLAHAKSSPLETVYSQAFMVE